MTYGSLSFEPMISSYCMIHEADPQSRQLVITIFTQGVRPYVRLKTLKSSDNHCGLAEWIIDDSCLVLFYFQNATVKLNFERFREIVLDYFTNQECDGVGKFFLGYFDKDDF